MAWKKLGRIFLPDGSLPWARTHAAYPCATPLEGSRYRIYYSPRDEANRGSIGYIEIDLHAPERIIAASHMPVLSPGKRGYFDDSGVSVSQIVPHEGGEYLYYGGWNLGTTVPFRKSLGLAIRKAGQDQFVKYSNAPIMDRDDTDPLSLSFPYVMREDKRWRMWYGSMLSWEHETMDMQCTIKYAESSDGIHWQRTGRICIPLMSDESAVVRPAVLKTAQGYSMFFSRRIGSKLTYRMGYAESSDGITWQRRDVLAGIEASPQGWDSEMIYSPHVFVHDDTRYLLYNGNGFGRTGFGLAVWEP